MFPESKKKKKKNQRQQREQQQLAKKWLKCQHSPQKKKSVSFIQNEEEEE